MDPDLALIVIAVISLTAIVGRTVVKITNARLAAGTGQPDELKARVEELESTVHGLQQELVEAQERLDFAERLLAKGAGQAEDRKTNTYQREIRHVRSLRDESTCRRRSTIRLSRRSHIAGYPGRH